MTTTPAKIVQIPTKFSVVGQDGFVSQPWAYFLNNVTARLPSTTESYIIDGTANTNGPTTIYQGPAGGRGGSPAPNSIYIADDTGEIFTVADGQWQIQTPELSGDVLKAAFSNTTTLATVNSTPGTYGSTATIPVITVNAKGLITNVSAVPFPSFSVPGAAGNFVYSLDGSGLPGSSTLYNIDTYTITYKLAFHQADASPLLVCTVPINTVISKVELTILTAFNGTAPTISVGSNGSYNDLMATTDNNPMVLSNWSVEPGVEYVATSTPIKVSISAGSGSAGYALVVITTVQL